MSHDAWLEIDSGGPEPVHLMDIGNYTRNVSPMWRKAMAAAAGRSMAIQDTEGMTGEQAGPTLALALAHMEMHPEEYEPLNPKNGWGNYEGAMEFVAKCADACAANPRAVIRWSV